MKKLYEKTISELKPEVYIPLPKQKHKNGYTKEQLKEWAIAKNKNCNECQNLQLGIKKGKRCKACAERIVDFELTEKDLR